jgi:hypothetical protein
MPSNAIVADAESVVSELLSDAVEQAPGAGRADQGRQVGLGRHGRFR